MNISINRQVLLEELNNASKIIDIKSLTPATTAVLMEVGIDKLTIVSTNNSTSFKTELDNSNSDLDVKSPGRILVKPKFIVETLRKLETQFVNLSSFDENELEIVTDKSSLKIGLLDPEDFPLFGFVENGIEISLSPSDFKHTINETISSINPYKERIILTGMNLRTEQNKIVFSSTDLFRISLKEIAVQNESEEINITIPYKTLIELNKLLDGIKKFKIIIFEGYATFVLDNKILQSILVDGNFPNVESAFPSTFQTTLVMKTKKIAKLLSRFELPFEIAESTITVRISKNEILFKTTADTIKYEESFNDFKFEGEELEEIRFNTRFLLDAIKTFDVENLTIKFVAPQRPIFISSNENPSLKQVVLPTHLG